MNNLKAGWLFKYLLGIGLCFSMFVFGQLDQVKSGGSERIRIRLIPIYDWSIYFQPAGADAPNSTRLDDYAGQIISSIADPSHVALSVADTKNYFGVYFST
ncbi:hypothetical protein EV127DRAFT_408721 [Xylaria flabelliformis]|nr:hypothetical protein EV127DRAFT_408721 [Xylaria flabelliformis]